MKTAKLDIERLQKAVQAALMESKMNAIQMEGQAIEKQKVVLDSSGRSRSD